MCLQQGSIAGGITSNMPQWLSHDKQAAMQMAMPTSAIPMALPCAYALSSNNLASVLVQVKDESQNEAAIAICSALLQAATCSKFTSRGGGRHMLSNTSSHA